MHYIYCPLHLEILEAFSVSTQNVDVSSTFTTLPTISSTVSATVGQHITTSAILHHVSSDLSVDPTTTSTVITTQLPQGMFV